MKKISPKVGSTSSVKIFIAGPMTGIEHFNFPLFDSVAESLRKEGYQVVNPVDVCRRFKKEHVLADKKLFDKMISQQQELEKTCNVLLLLPGWEDSKGVRLELKTAIEKDMQIVQWRDVKSVQD